MPDHGTMISEIAEIIEQGTIDGMMLSEWKFIRSVQELHQSGGQLLKGAADTLERIHAKVCRGPH